MDHGTNRWTETGNITSLAETKTDKFKSQNMSNCT